MATKKRLSLIYELKSFANTYLGKVTKFQGDGLFRFGAIYWPGGGKFIPPLPGMNRVKLRTKRKLALTFSWVGLTKRNKVKSHSDPRKDNHRRKPHFLFKIDLVNHLGHLCCRFEDEPITLLCRASRTWVPDTASLGGGQYEPIEVSTLDQFLEIHSG